MYQCGKCGKFTVASAHEYKFVFGKTVSGGSRPSGDYVINTTYYQIVHEPMTVPICHKCMSIHLWTQQKHSDTKAVLAFLGAGYIVVLALAFLCMSEVTFSELTNAIIFLTVAGTVASLLLYAYIRKLKLKRKLAEEKTMLENRPLESFEFPDQEEQKKKWQDAGDTLAISLKQNELESAGFNAFWTPDCPHLRSVLRNSTRI